MKNITSALGAVLLFLFVSISSASADTDRNRYEGTIIADSTLCIDHLADEVFATYNVGDYVEILPKSPTDLSPDDLVLTYSATSGFFCYVASSAVEYLPDSRVYDDEVIDDLPTLAPAVVIGTNFVNANDVNCRVSPSLDAEVRAVLQSGDIVTEFADGAIGDGWQWVGLEATDCHVSADLLGEKDAIASEPAIENTVAVTEPSTEDEIVYSEPMQVDTPPMVTQLPSTGDGTGDSSKVLISNIVFWGIWPVGLLIAACIARHLQNKGEKTLPVISR